MRRRQRVGLGTQRDQLALQAVEFWLTLAFWRIYAKVLAGTSRVFAGLLLLTFSVQGGDWLVNDW